MSVGDLKTLLAKVDALFPKPKKDGLGTYNYSLGKFPRGWQFVLTNNWYAWSYNGYKHRFGLYREPEYAVEAFLAYVKQHKINVKKLCHK
jgi:hypothetical protein